MELLKRVIVSLIFIPLLLLVYFYGGISLLVFLGLVSFAAMWEMRNIIKEGKNYYIPVLLIPLSIPVFLLSALKGFEYINFAIIGTFIIVAGNNVIMNKIEHTASIIGFSLMAMVYTVIMPASIYRISSHFPDYKLVLLLQVFCWTTDSFAYFVGMKFGKHRNIFKASPKKSLEGFLGGFFLTGLVGAIIYLTTDWFMGWHIVYAIISAGIFGQFGDLIESIIKRDLNVKDSSNLIPGHGGIIDRFDSLFVSAPIFYFLLLIFEFKGV
jgi:phosphatidate cytidylyltransferase